MTTKTHSQRTTAHKTRKGRPSKDATDQAMAADRPAPVEAAQVPNAATETTTRPDTSRPSAAEAIEPAPRAGDPPAAMKKLSALDAAAQILSESGQAMSCAELIAAMAAQGYWSSPKGRTPAATLYSAVLREMQSKGDKARFCKTGRGQFALRPTV